jgi:hypothetical protein
MKKIIIFIISFLSLWINTAFTLYHENDILINTPHEANLSSFIFNDNIYWIPYRKNRNSITNLLTNQQISITHNHWINNNNCWYWWRSTIFDNDEYYLIITDNYWHFSVETINKNNLETTIHCITTSVTPAVTFWIYQNKIILRINTLQYYIDLTKHDWLSPLYWNPNFWKIISIPSEDHLPIFYFWFSNIHQRHYINYNFNTLIKYNKDLWQIDILQYDDPYLVNTSSTNNLIIKENVIWHNIIRTNTNYILSLYLTDWTYQSFLIFPDELQYLDNYFYLKYSLSNDFNYELPRWSRIVNNYLNFWVSNYTNQPMIIPYIENNILRRLYYKNDWWIYINWSHVEWSFDFNDDNNDDENNDNNDNWWFLSNIANKISWWFSDLINFFKVESETHLDSFIENNLQISDNNSLSNIETTWSWFLIIDTTWSELNSPVLKTWITWSTTCEIINKNNLTFVYYSNTITWINFSLQNFTLLNNTLWLILDKITWVFIWPLNTVITSVWIITPLTQTNTEYCLMWKVFTLEHHKYFKDTEDYNQFTFLDYIVLMAFFILIYKTLYRKPIENTSSTLDEIKYQRTQKKYNLRNPKIKKK